MPFTLKPNLVFLPYGILNGAPKIREFLEFIQHSKLSVLTRRLVEFIVKTPILHFFCGGQFLTFLVDDLFFLRKCG